MKQGTQHALRRIGEAKQQAEMLRTKTGLHPLVVARLASVQQGANRVALDNGGGDSDLDTLRVGVAELSKAIDDILPLVEKSSDVQAEIEAGVLFHDATAALFRASYRLGDIVAEMRTAASDLRRRAEMLVMQADARRDARRTIESPAGSVNGNQTAAE